MVPIGERALAWVDRYLVEARLRLVVPPDAGVLVLTADGNGITPDHLTRLVGRYVAAATGKGGSCHTFRHTAATLMLEGGADIRYVQEMLGHALLSTTQICTQVSIEALRAVHTTCHFGATLAPWASPAPTSRTCPGSWVIPPCGSPGTSTSPPTATSSSGSSSPRSRRVAE